MPQISLDATGVAKGVLIECAYEYCGLNGQQYELTPEEMSTGLKRLNALMALLAKKGLDLGYDFPTFGNGLLEEPSGIPDDAVEPVSALLAKRLAPTLGASLTAEAMGILATAMSDLQANYCAAPPSRKPAQHFRSLGRRHTGIFVIDCDDASESPCGDDYP